MKESPKLYIVEGSKLPEVFLRVIEAKRLLQSKQAQTVNEAVKRTGISRSAFYKYKDSITLFTEMSEGRIITFGGELSDEPGVLSRLLNLLAKLGANILTINQNIPIDGRATVSISARTGGLEVDIDDLLEQLEALPGVIKFEILASEKGGK
ncbi:MAG: ACT domain-containing protein [Clostridiales bacterium]|nr:ACT domain-containing protein [Clostridiales bacterium]